GDSLTWRIVRSEGETIPIKIRRGDEVKVVGARPQIPPSKFWNRKGLRQIQILPAETPMVAKVAPESPAAKAGLKPNDLLTEINGQRLYSSMGISEYARTHPEEPLVLPVQRGAETLKCPFSPDGAEVEAVIKGSPAEAAGLKPGDYVVGVDGHPSRVAAEITDYIQKHAGAPITLQLERQGEKVDIQITPQLPANEKTPRIGVAWTDHDGITLDAYGKFTVVRPGPVEQIRAGVLTIFNTIDAIISRKSDVKLQHMGGPVMMMRVYYIMFESPEGWRMALWFSVVLNVNLALINLLPIPVLDGGHITLAFVEAA